MKTAGLKADAIVESSFANKRAATVLVGAAVVFAIGCSGAADPDNDLSTEPDMQMTNGTDMTVDESDMAAEPDMAAEQPTVVMTATFSDQATAESLSGVRVCVFEAEPENCAETDSAGAAQLQVPAGSEITLAASREAYYSALIPFVTADEDFDVGLTIATEAMAFGLLGVVGVTQDPANGGVAVIITGTGVTPVLEPGAGDEPWYLVGADISRSDTGTFALQSAVGISNIPPGDYVIAYEHDTNVCQPTNGWAAGEPNEQSLPIRAGYLTSLFSLDCQ